MLRFLSDKGMYLMKYQCNLVMANLNIFVKSDFEICITDSIKPFINTLENSADVVYEICDKATCSSIKKLCYESKDYCVYKSKQGYIWQFMSKGEPFYLYCLNSDRSRFRLEITNNIYENISKVIFSNYLAFENPMLQYHAYWLHASLVKWKGRGIVFTAPSGGGKSTQAELWKKHLGAEILNGDRALLRRNRNEIRAYGSLYAGSSGIYCNENVPLSMAVILQKGEENRLEKVEQVQAFAALYSQVLANPWDSWYIKKIVEEITCFLQKVPVYRLICRPDENAVDTVKQELLNL